MLDETDARVILLLAPAGYGKTTLARQWAKTLNTAIWIGLTTAHRDLANVAEDIAQALEPLDPDAVQFIGEFVRARSNPQRAAREIASALAARLDSNRINWLFVDDYHALDGDADAGEMFKLLIERTRARVVVATRTRPAWATSRRQLYEETVELRREELALTNSETREVLGSRRDLDELAEQAQGWPAVVSLATRLPSPRPSVEALPMALHEYVAQELFDSASDELRQSLLAIALLPDTSAKTLEQCLGRDWRKTVGLADELGFMSCEADYELHPLLREFLLSKLREVPGADSRVAAAIAQAAELGAWETALDLVMRFELRELIEPTLTSAYQPLLRSGRLGTLSRFSDATRIAPLAQPVVVDLVDAEIALHDGQFHLAADLGERVRGALLHGHPLASRAGAIVGQSRSLLADFSSAEEAYEFASASAQNDLDQSEALHGLAITRIFGERKGAQASVSALAERQNLSAADLARYLIAELSHRAFGAHLHEPLHLEHARHALVQVEDPRVRTALTYRAAYALALRAEYATAEEWMQCFFDDATKFMLDFTLPYARWAEALIKLGRRQFGLAEASLQYVEDAAEARQNENHLFNARVLRARLLLQTGQPEEATRVLGPEPRPRLIPSWRGEHFATRALVMACQGDERRSEEAALAAERTSGALEVRMLAASARAVTAARKGQSCGFLFESAEETNVWDPVVCALRSSHELAEAAATLPEWQTSLEALYARSFDRFLAKRAGFRTRSRQSPETILSPRELEVLSLIARGLRNKQIAKALFIAESTTKVHVRHVFEKLGVRSRAQAAARYETLARGDNTSDGASSVDGS